jgi:hypothetical protein
MDTRKTISLASLALLFGATEPALSQSADVPRNVESRRAHAAFDLLGWPMPHTTATSRARGYATDAVALGLASARVYRFTTADFPGAALSVVFDANNSTIVGDFSFNPSGTPPSPTTGFVLHSAVYQTLTVPGSLGASILTGINTGGEMIGVYTDFGGKLHGFLDNAGVFTNIDESSGTTEPIGINDSGEIVGGHDTHAFLTADRGATFRDFDVPGAASTQAAGVNSAGDVVGGWVDSTSKSHGFLLSGGIFTSLDFPLASSTTAIGINDSNEIAGAYSDASGATHGFIYSAGAYTRVDVAGATGTQLSRIKNNGRVTGVYSDALNESHGFSGH